MEVFLIKGAQLILSLSILVILHELGHVLGFPTIWKDPLYDLLQDEGTSNPFFTGGGGSSLFTLVGGTLVNGLGVPIENSGGTGTRDSHWREAVMGNELMTGFVSAGSKPLSAITIGSFQDIGYEVNLDAADAYSLTLPGALLNARRSPRCARRTPAC